jgi:hypothetical protein
VSLPDTREDIDSAQNRRINRLEEQVSAVSTAHAVTREVLVERIDGLKEAVQQLAARPSPGVPVWVVLSLAVPNMILAVAGLIGVIYLLMARG